MLSSIVSAMILAAQEKITADTNAVKSIDGIVKEVLRLVSGERGRSKNFEALRYLFLPTATFIVHNNFNSASDSVETASLEDFIKMMQDDYYEIGYLECETGKTVNEYNGIASVFQSFYGKDSENKENKIT